MNPIIIFVIMMALLRSAAAFSRTHHRRINLTKSSPESACRIGGGESTRFQGSAACSSVRRPHSTRRHFVSSRHDAHDDVDETMHLKHYSISGVGKKSSTNTTTDTGHVIMTDVPINMGGENAAPQPVEYLLASLIGCTQATAMYVSRNMRPRLYIDTMDFDIRAYRDERGALSMIEKNELPSMPSRLIRVHGTVAVHFKGRRGVLDPEVTREQLRMLAMQTEARCPIASMMHSSGCVMDIEWVVNESGGGARIVS